MFFTSGKKENDELEKDVHKRTRTLEKKVRTFERNEVERQVWQDKLDKSLNDGTTRLEALTAMIGKQELINAVRTLRGK